MISYLSISNSSYFLSILAQILKFKNKNDCKMLKMINPIKICILVSEILDLISSTSTQLKTESGELRSKYLKLASCLIEEPNEKWAVEQALKDNDLEERQVLDLICLMDYYEVLNNSVVQQMSLKIWNGPHSTQGRFYDTSTIFKVVGNSESVFELRNCVNDIYGRTPNKIKTLVESFVSWKDCAKVKYYNNIALFFIFNLFFQLIFNFFTISLSSKIESMKVLLFDVRLFVPHFNGIYNTTFSLTEILGNASSNKTFQYFYVLPLDNTDMSSLSKFIFIIRKNWISNPNSI